MKQNRTRTALADAYMHLLNDYTIDRITVKMITDAVGCSRKTFYYYFTDVYVLTQYVFELRVQQFLDTNGNFETMREGFLTLAANLSNDRQAILNIYHGYGKEELERFTWETSDYYARQVITRYAQNMDIAPEDLEAIIRMYTDMMFGMLIDWINNGMEGDYSRKLDIALTALHAGAARQLPQRESGGGQRPVNRIKTPGSRERSRVFFSIAGSLLAKPHQHGRNFGACAGLPRCEGGRGRAGDHACAHGPGHGLTRPC